MKHRLLYLALSASLVAAAPSYGADCYADYKAKQDSPLRLHYGVIQLHQSCARKPAKPEIRARLKQDGWTLLNVLSVFGPEGLQERKANAGTYFLRF